MEQATNAISLICFAVNILVPCRDAMVTANKMRNVRGSLNPCVTRRALDGRMQRGRVVDPPKQLVILQTLYLL